MAQLTLGFLLSEDPNRFLEFACQVCPHWVRKPLPDVCIALGEGKRLGDVRAKCTRCGARADKVTVRVWKDTWSGPR